MTALVHDMIAQLEQLLRAEMFMDEPLEIILNRDDLSCVPALLQAFEREVERSAARLSDWEGIYEDLDHMLSARVAQLAQLGIVEMLPYLVRLLRRDLYDEDYGTLGERAAASLAFYPSELVLAQLAQQASIVEGAAARDLLAQLESALHLTEQALPHLLTLLKSTPDAEIIDELCSAFTTRRDQETIAAVLEVIAQARRPSSPYREPEQALRAALMALLQGLDVTRGVHLLAQLQHDAEASVLAASIAQELGIEDALEAGALEQTIQQLTQEAWSAASWQERCGRDAQARRLPTLYSGPWAQGSPSQDLIEALDVALAERDPLQDLDDPSAWDWMRERWMQAWLMFRDQLGDADRDAFVSALHGRFGGWPDAICQVWDVEALLKGVDCPQEHKLWPLYRSLTLTRRADQPAWSDSLGLRLLASRRDLSGLRELVIYGDDADAGMLELCEVLAALPQLGGLDVLIIQRCALNDAALTTLLSAPHLHHLKRLQLEDNALSDLGVERLLEVPWPRLQVLRLFGNDAISAASLERAHAPYQQHY